VVTVPASFQAAQRQNSADAAELGGFVLGEGALLDEPVAAFILKWQLPFAVISAACLN
jgi:molecular chaperone DnaK